MPHRVPPPTEPEIRAELLVRAAQRERSSLVSTAVGVGLVMALTWASGVVGIGLVFAVTRLAAMVHNDVVARRIIDAAEAGRPSGALEARLVGGTAAAGVSWGVVVRAIHPSTAGWSMYDLQLTILLAIVSALLLISTSNVPKLMWAFNAGLWFTALVQIFGRVGPSQWMLAVGVFWGVLLLYGYQLHDQTRSAVIAELRGRRLSSELERANERLREALEQAMDEASRDPLTLASNRRAFFERAAVEAKMMARFRDVAAVLVVDLDLFKAINDRFGHPVGDEVLRAAAGVMLAGLRASDVLVRWGGEEFLVLLPRTSVEAAVVVAERIRTSIAATRAPGWPDGVAVTASVGVAAWLPDTPVDAAVVEADRALYRAKAAGRDRVVRADSPPA
ncbi:MAG: GGDEF domain-containing protein [Myxococcota bacterium]